MAYADTTSRELGVCEFSDNDQFSNVEVWFISLCTVSNMHSPSTVYPGPASS